MTRFTTLFLFSILAGWFNLLSAQGFTMHPLKEQCAENEEIQLYELLTEYRRIHNLPPIPLSKSLSYVARIHAMDIAFNRPDFGGCNPHSWSAKGNWKPCCYSRDEKRLNCMNDKPKELTTYKAKAWEIVYEGGETAKAIDAFELWKNISITKDYLLNTGKWTKPWKAMGIGFYGDYAAVWFGEGDDPETEYFTCGNEPILLNKPAETNSVTETAKSGEFYIITGSLNSIEKANREVVRLRSLGYQKAKIIPSGNNFRIAIASFENEAEAGKSLKELKAEFPQAWILRPE